MSLNAKLVVGVLGVLGLIGIGYVASRVGNIAARGVRDGGGAIELTVSEPILPGVPVLVRWNTALGYEATPVAVRARGQAGEVVVGRGEFASGQAMVTIPCEMGGQEIALLLHEAPAGGAGALLAWAAVEVLPAGPDCLR